MLSTILELLGLAALAAAAYLLGGPAPTLIVAGVELLFLGYSVGAPSPAGPEQRRRRRAAPGGPLTREKLAQDKG